MFKEIELDITHMYTNGRVTRFLFGLEKPYPKRKTVRRIIQMTDYYMEKYPSVNLVLVGMYTNGRVTRFLFGLEKPYPKRKTVRRIIQMTDYYMEKYPSVNLVLVGDGLSTAKAEKEYGVTERYMDGKAVTPQDPGIRAMHTSSKCGLKSIITFNSYWINKSCNWDFLGNGNRIKKRVDIDDVTKKDYIQYIFIHEFAHAFNSYWINKSCNWDFLGNGNRIKKRVDIDDVTKKDYIQYIFIHEFAHALDLRYCLSDNKTIKKIYENCSWKFTDIGEFIAECFVVSELYRGNEIPDLIRESIEDIVNR